MISLVHVTKTFNTATGLKMAVNDISFNTRAGEIIGFVGPNGAGKTTTMRLILGYLAPSEGKITINNLSPLDNRIAVLKMIGYLPENNPLYSEMQVNDYLRFVAQIKEADNLQIIIDQIGLAEVLSSKIEELSRGFKQRVGLAAAMLGSPEILILDEPTSGLDPIEQEKIRNLIRQLAEKKTIIFSTHILSEVEDIASRIIIINQGRLVYDGSKPKGKGAVEKLFKKLIKQIND